MATTVQMPQSTEQTQAKKIVKPRNVKVTPDEPVESEPASVPVPLPVSDPAAGVVEVKDELDGGTPTKSVVVTFASVFAKVAVGMAKFKEIASDLKTLQKETTRLAKESIRRPRRIADPSAEPSGFRKPVGLSPEMAKFVGVDLDAKVSRNNVTKAVTTYIKAHNLQDTPDKRVILPDGVLKGLLGIEDQKLTYFNLQSFLKKHFLKAESVQT